MSTDRLAVHFVGSLPLSDTESVLRTVCGALGPHLRRIPDGETGPRRVWVGMVGQKLHQHPAFELDPDEPRFVMRLSSGKVFREYARLRLRAGIAPGSVKFETGYADSAQESFSIFDRLQRQGVIPDHVRFQVSIPSPIAVTYNYISSQYRAPFLDVFSDHLVAEVGRIAARLPKDRIAIQWDVVHEILLCENYFPDRPADFREQFMTALQKISEAVAEPIELGYHLCYGSPEEEHLVQPRDTETMVGIMNDIVRRVRRPVSYFQIPVPKLRTDAAFYRPLGELALPARTELYMGLVHADDAAGNRRRLDLALEATRITGIASECGLGRSDPARLAALLECYRKLLSTGSSPA